MNDINERFRIVRKALEMNQAEYSKVLGITRSGINEIENGRRNVTDKHIKLLCIKPINGKSINEEWLRSGTGEMFKQHPLSDEVGYYVEDLLEYDGEGNPFYDMIIEMMKKYHELDAKSKVVIREYFKSIAKSIKKEAEED